MRYYFLIFAFLGLALCPAVKPEYFITISPSGDEGLYKMRIGEVVTFEANAFMRTEPGAAAVDIDQKVWWEYDKRLFDKAGSDYASITLKANGEGAAKLAATALVKNDLLKKSIDISVIK